MVRKRIVSVLLVVVMVFSMSSEVFAATLNMTSGKNEVMQVQTDTEQYFNVIFQEKEWEPTAEDYDVIYMGGYCDMWRYSYDKQKSVDGDQRWATPFGYLTDYELKDVMQGTYSGDTVRVDSQLLPSKVQAFLNSGGSWEDIRVTFQCENKDGVSLDPSQIFQDGAVEACLKWESEIQLAYKPYFKGSKDLIPTTTVVKGQYPYSNTMFSMWGKNNDNKGTHYGSVMVYDTENGEDEYAPNKYDGYNPLLFIDIKDKYGNLTAGKNLKNLEYPGDATKKPGISTDTARIGDGTFGSGGAIGIHFEFPVKITFEINPIEDKGNQMYLSEYSIVSMSDNAKPDELTTHASLQAYSNKKQLTNFVGGKDAYDALAKVALLKAFGSQIAGVDDKILQLIVDKTYTADLLCTMMDMLTAGEIEEELESGYMSDTLSTKFGKLDSEVIDRFNEKNKYSNFIGTNFNFNINDRDDVSKIVSADTDTVFGNTIQGIQLKLTNEGNRIYNDMETLSAEIKSEQFISDLNKAGRELAGVSAGDVGKTLKSTHITSEAVKDLLSQIGTEIENGNLDANEVLSNFADIVDGLSNIELYNLASGYAYNTKVTPETFVEMYGNAIKYQANKTYYNELYGDSVTSTPIYQDWFLFTGCGNITLSVADLDTYNEDSSTLAMFNKCIDSYKTSLLKHLKSKIDTNSEFGDKYSDIKQYVESVVGIFSNMAYDEVAIGSLSRLIVELADNFDDVTYNTIKSMVASLNAEGLQDSSYGAVLSGENTVNKMSANEKMAVESSAIGRYLIKDADNTYSTSTSLITTGNYEGMLNKIEDSDAKVVILLPTINHSHNKEIGQDAFRKLAYARSERLYELIKNGDIFSEVTLNQELEDRLLTDNADDIKILDVGKYQDILYEDMMGYTDFKDKTYFHTNYTVGNIGGPYFTRLFQHELLSDGDKKTLEQLNIIGNGNQGDIYWADGNEIIKIKERYSANSTSLWNLNAFKFDSSEEVRNFLESAVWRSGYAAVTISEAENASIDNSLNYNGSVAYTDVILDRGCDVIVDAFSINKDGTINKITETRQGMTFPYKMPRAATRYSLYAPFETDAYPGLENPALTEEINGAYSMVASIPEGMSDEDFYLNAEKLVKESIAEGKATDEAILEGYGIKIAVGRNAVKNCLVYPSDEQLENETPIRLALFYAEIEKPEMVKVYELTDGSITEHVKTTTIPAEVTDDTVVVEDETMDGTEYNVGEAYVSTDLYDVTNTTPWSEIDNHTDAYDNEVIYDAGELTLDPEKQQRIYVRMVGELPTSTTAPTGNYNITQQTIGKMFDTSGLGISVQDCLTSYSKTRHKYYTIRGNVRRCNIYATSDDTYSLDYSMTTNGDSKIFSNITPSESGDKTGSKTWNKSRNVNTTLKPIYTFVAWRGYDKPVAASYANESWVLNDVSAKYGISSAKERENSELNSSYTKPVTFNWVIGSGSDTHVWFSCSHGYTHSGTVGQYGEHSGKGTVSVQVYEGWKGAQTPTNSSPASTSMGGASLTSTHKGTTTGDVITYHPYVMMKYQDINGNTNSVNVLSKYKSSITPTNTIEFGVQKGSDSSLGITSSMWSTHKRATNAKGANNVIAGGATYNLGNNGAQLPKIGVTTYQWYVPNDAVSAVVSGAGNTQTKAEQSHNDAVSSLKAALTGNKVLQHLKAGSNNYVVAPGMSTPWLGSGLNLTNNTNAESKKYWFGGMVNPKTKIISDDGTTREYYRISSDTSGGVVLTKGNHTDHIFTINQDNDYILNHMNAEWKEINAKTGLVSAYLGSIIRRAGDDSSYGATGGMWYNEAFPGLCVVKQTTTFTVGMDTGTNASLQNVVDMRLIAGGTSSKADIYNNFNDSWFAVEGKNVNFNFRGKDLTLNTGELNLRSKTFYIPNATVYDND